MVIAVSEPFAIAGTGITAPFRALGDGRRLGGRSRPVRGAPDSEPAVEADLASLEEAKLQNDRIRALVDFAKAQNLPTIGANVIGRPTDSLERSILIDRGTSSGVKEGDAVIAAGGLVGEVVAATPLDAQVRLITDSESGVAVLVQRTRVNGHRAGDHRWAARTRLRQKSQAPVVGDVLITSGLGGVYPKGIVVGEVTQVSVPQSGLFDGRFRRLARRHRPYRGGPRGHQPGVDHDAAGRRRVNKALSAAIALLAAFVLQVSIASHIAIFGVVPNFMFLVVVTIALTQGPVAGGVSGLVGGLLFDLLGAASWSVRARAGRGGLRGRHAHANLFAEGWLLPVSVVAVASLATEVAHGIVLVVLGTGLGFWHELVMVMLPSVIYHTALAVIVYPLLARLLRAERPMKSFRHLA